MKIPVWMQIQPVDNDSIAIIAVGIPKSYNDPKGPLTLRLYRLSDMGMFSNSDEPSLESANNYIICDQRFREGLVEPKDIKPYPHDV